MPERFKIGLPSNANPVLRSVTPIETVAFSIFTGQIRVNWQCQSPCRRRRIPGRRIFELDRGFDLVNFFRL